MVRALNTLGWFVLIGAVWLLAARAAGWDSATVANALVFAVVVYSAIRTAR